MSRTSRLLAVLLLLALLAAACTGGDDEPEDPASESAQDPTEEADDPAAPDDDADDDVTDDGPAPEGDLPIPVVDGYEPDVDADILQAAQQWIANESGLTAMLQEEIFLAEVSQTQDVYHLTYLQQHDDVAVRGAQFIVHIRDTGEVIGASQSLTETLPGDGVTEELDEAAAVEVAVKAVPGTPTGEPIVTATWLETGTTLSLGWEVLVATTGPPANYAVVVDATSGEVLSVDELGTDAHAAPRGGRSDAAVTAVAPRQRTVAQAGPVCEAPAAPSACIFVVDPIFASGDPTISPERANLTTVGVSLDNLVNPSDGNLIGAYAQIAPEIASQYADPDNVFGEGGRGSGDITFEAAMTYYWIDYSQQILQELGYDYHADDPVDFVPIEPEFPDNAFYLFVQDRIHMGDAPDGVREAEDAQGVIHEYGHAILQSAVPNIVSDEGGAFHEGFADLASIFTTLEFRNGDVPCLFHWAERGRCIRRVDTDLVYPDDLRFEVHLDAEIYTGAVWDIFEGVLARDTGLVPTDCQDRSVTPTPCDAVRDEVYGTLLGSLPFLTPVLDLQDAAAAFAASDAAFYGGRNAEIITDAFAAHGLDATGSTGVQVMSPGDLMDTERADSQIALKIVHEFRGDLQVDVGVFDAGDAQLCQLSLITPDGQDGSDNITGRFDLAGTDCEAHLPPSPEQRWAIRVIDTASVDTGTLFQFTVIHQGVRYPADGLPLDIPDADAQGVVAIVSGAPGGGQTTTPQDQQMFEPEGGDAGGGDTTAGPVEADIAITHTYVGDLAVQVAVADAATGQVTCRVDVLQPNPQDASSDFATTADVSACAASYPPTAERVWVLRVSDNAGIDEGQVTTFTLRGPDGVERSASVPVAIPDNDPEGVVLQLAP